MTGIPITRIAAAALLLLAAYALGLASAHYGLFPWPQIVAVKQQVIGPAPWLTNDEYRMSEVPVISAERYSTLATPAEIVMVGDSVTAAGRWDEYFPEASIINRGVNGDMIGGLEKRVDAILASRPEKVFIMIGINDIAARNSAPQVAERYGRVLDAFAAGGAELFVQSVITCRPAGRTSCPPAMQDEIGALNAMLRDLAAEKDATFVDVDAALSDEGGVKAQYSLDGIHPGSAGYAAWRRVLAPYIGAAS